MPHETSASPTRTGGTLRRWILWAILGIAVLAVAFGGGLFAGRWAVKNQLSARLRAAWAERFPDQHQYGADTAGPTDWGGRPTALVRIETTTIHLPNSEGWGGGLQALADGRIFYATRTGEFGLIDANGVTHGYPFRVDLNWDGLRKHPIFKVKNFNYNWFRVTDINLTPRGAGRYELLVGHHRFDEVNQCVELHLSRALIELKGEEFTLVEPFESLLTTKPCITFYRPGYEFAYEGHFSGGRIARLDADRVLFSTGDHGWVGLRGYPAVSQEDDATLGKILLVNLRSREVGVYAKGVRNPQGLTIDSKGRIWETEHGPRGGDKLNLIVQGGNYGWPYATYGTDYGPRPWPHNAVQGRPEFGTLPVFAWVPSIATSNVIEVRGEEFALWKGDLLVATLGGQALHRLRLDGNRVVYDEPIKFDGERLRDLIELPSGVIALLTDSGTVILVRNGDHPKGPRFLDPAKAQRKTADMSAEERAYAVAGRYPKGQQAVATAEPELPPAAARGEAVFKASCATCHTLSGPTALVGPSLQGVVGRRVGATDFAYSAGLSGQTDLWSPGRIVEFAGKPADLYPGSVMPPVALSADAKRDLASYLEIEGR